MHAESLENARAILTRGSLVAFSLDVFDTTLLRRCTTPDGVFERAFELAPIPASKRGMREAFVQQRQLAESKLRADARKADRSPEITIDEIYREFPTAVFGLKRDAWAELAKAEFLAECELCFANPEILPLIAEAQARGIRTGFLSDTYWDHDRLTRLLQACAPGLRWDFLYASCDHRNGKGEKLFPIMLEEQGFQPDRMVHLGDNPIADVRAANKAGIQAIHYPQASPDLGSVFQRETAIFRLMCADNGASSRLDAGARTARRRMAAWAPSHSAAFTYGAQVLGPIMTAFDRFVAGRVEALERKGGKVAIAFLARDGLLPLEIWQAVRERPVSYSEINRRIALVAGSLDITPLQSFFSRVPMVNRAVITGFLKEEPPALTAYFKITNDQPVSGREFSEYLPDLLNKADLGTITSRLRRGLVAHLRASIPNFDECTDLVLVDLGYSGTVQKAMRTILRAEGLPQRLHGLYLMTADEAFHTLDEHDSAEGFLSDAVMLPHVKRAVLCNIALIEQLCSAPVGSVCSYADDGTLSREDDPRSTDQLEFCATLREGAIHCARSFATLSGYPDPFTDEAAAASWAGAILARAVLLPTDAELALLGPLRHDINLGSQALAPMADAKAARSFAAAKPLPMACTPHEPPMWMAASMAALSPVHGFLYALNGAGHLPGEVAGELSCGEAEIVLIAGENGHPLKVTCQRDGFGQFRMRIPFLRKNGITAIAVPATALPGKGMVSAIAFQAEDTAQKAMSSQSVVMLPVEQCQAIGGIIHQGFYSEWEQDGILIIPVPIPQKDVAVVTVTITLTDAERILAW